MHVILVSSRHHPSQGGIGTAVWWFIHVAARAGWRVDLITRFSDNLPPGAHVHCIRTIDEQPEFALRIAALRRIDRIRPYRYGLWSLAVARYLLEMKCDADAIEFVDAQAEGYVALTSPSVRERWGSTPMYIQAHSPMWLIESLNQMDRQRFGREIYHEWERAAMRAADGVISPSQMLLNALPSRHRASIIPHPMRIEEKTTRPTRGNIILLVGDVEPNKGILAWTKSLNIVLSQHKDATAVLCGPDTPTAPRGESMARYVRKLIEPELRCRFQWNGAASHEHVQELVHRAAMVVVPSRFESFSFVAAEAIAAGCPVIISDRVGIIEHVASITTVPVDDVAALAKAQLHILLDPIAGRQKTKLCCEQLTQACCPDVILRRREECVRSLTARKTNVQKREQDSITRMERFLHDVERSERESAQPVAVTASSSL